MTDHPFRLPKALDPGNEQMAVDVLKKYYAPLELPNNGFTGSIFDTFDPSGTRERSADVFTSDDMVALSLLSISVPIRAAVELLSHQRERFSGLLGAVGPDRDLVDETSTARDAFAPAWSLWGALMELPGVGATTASKLMARKRPRLIPVFDSVINRHVLGGRGSLWAALHHALTVDDRVLFKKLVSLRRVAELPEAVSPLRVFDVLAWMEGTGNLHPGS